MAQLRAYRRFNVRYNDWLAVFRVAGLWFWWVRSFQRGRRVAVWYQLLWVDMCPRPSNNNKTNTVASAEQSLFNRARVP